MTTIANRNWPVWSVTPRFRAVAALVCLVVIVLGMNLQLVVNLSTHVIGRPFEDVFEVLWQLSWVRDAIFQQGVSPLFAPAIYYPQGWYLASGAQPVWWMIAFSPLTAMLGAVTTYNVVMLATFVVGAWGVYLLMQHLTRNFLASLLAGCIYAFAPVLILRQGGHLHILLSMQWLPYVALLSHQSLVTPTRRYLLSTGLLLALSILGHWQFLFMAPLVPLCIIGFAQATRPWRQRLGLLLRVGAVALIVLAPFALHTAYARGQMFTEPAAFSIVTQDAASLSPDRLLVPSPGQPWWGAWSREQFPLRGEADVVSIGYAALILAVLGLARGGGFRRAYVVLTALALIMALGITLHWNARPVTIALPPSAAGPIRSIEAQLLGPDLLPPGDLVLVPMPLAFLSRVVPLLNEARVWARYDIIAMLGVAVLAGLGAACLVQQRARRGAWVVIGLLAVVLVENVWMPYTSFTEVATNTRPVDMWLAARSAPINLIEYPLPASNKLAMYRQALHGQNVANGYMSVAPTYYARAAAALGAWPNPAALPLLRDWKVDYILVNGTNNVKFTAEVLPAIQAVSGLCLEREDNEPARNRHTYLFRIMLAGQTCAAKSPPPG